MSFKTIKPDQSTYILYTEVSYHIGRYFEAIIIFAST